jgi:hypothetical protein
MFPVTSCVTCFRAMPGVYRLYYQNRRAGGAAMNIDNLALCVPRSFTGSRRVFGPLRDAAGWLESIEDAGASHLAAA